MNFSATGIYSDATEVNITLGATWDSSDTGVAIVWDWWLFKGFTIGLTPGTTTITATYQGHVGSATLTVQ